MNSTEFYLWLNGYFEALETNGITECKIEKIREKMKEVRPNRAQERVVYGPNITPQAPTQTNYKNTMVGKNVFPKQ